LSGYQRGIKPQESDVPSKRTLECQADNCPLPGVIGVTRTTSLCRAHDGMPAHLWPAITGRLQIRLKAFQVALDLLNASSGSTPDPRIEAAFVRTFGAVAARKTKFYGFPEQKPPARGNQLETARDYGNRMYMLLLREARGEPLEIPAEARQALQQLKPQTIRPPVDIEL
jgi:hypothetical protein